MATVDGEQFFNDETGHWEASKPLPYYPQPDLRGWRHWRRAVLLVTLFRKFKCRTRWCVRPAVEVGSTCDLHGPWID